MAHPWEPIKAGPVEARLILLSGLGADQRQWEPQRRAFPDAIAPEWVQIEAGETLAGFARRFGESLPIGRHTVLAGSSFGGMLALEIARQRGVKPACVVLLGSTRVARAVNPALRVVEWLARAIPDGVVDRCRWLGLPFVGRGGGISRENRRLLRRMASEVPVRFLRRAARAIVEWPGCPDPGVPVRHIHGDRDWVLLLGRLGPARPDEVVPGGAHVINLSRVERVNAFLALCIDEATGRATASATGASACAVTVGSRDDAA